MGRLSSNVPVRMQPPCRFDPARLFTPNPASSRTSLPFAAFRRSVRAAAWCPRIIRCCVAATCLALCSPLALAQEQPEPALNAFSALPPDPQSAMAAYDAVERWVREWSVPQDAAAAPARTSAVCIVLRYQGAIVGRGQAEGDNCLAAAARAAIEEGTQRIMLTTGIGRESMLEVARGVQISLELAGPLVPARPLSYEDADLAYSTGVFGAAARVGTRTSMVFPSALLTTGQLTGDGLVAAAARALQDPAGVVRTDAAATPQSLAQRGVTFYTFRTTHIAQAAPQRAPNFLFRGGRVVAPSEITRDALLEFRANLAARLERWFVVEPDGAFVPHGTYHASRGKHEPARSTTLGFLFGLLALTETPGHEAHAAKLFASASSLMSASPADWAKPEVASMTLACIGAAKARNISPGFSPEQTALLADAAAFAFDPQNGWAAGVSEGEKSIVCLGLAWRAALSPPSDAEPAKELAGAAVRAVLRDIRPGMLISHMPWLGRAELLLAGEGPVPSATVLREMRDETWRHALKADEAGEDGRDMAGGIVFTSGGAKLPTWSTARGMCFLATMLGDPRLTPESDRIRELARILESIRFLRQLALDEHSAYAAADPAFALWGVRVAVWDDRQTPEATALTLLTVNELLASLDAMRKPAKPTP